MPLFSLVVGLTIAIRTLISRGAGPLLPNGLSSWAVPRMWRGAWLLLLRAKCSKSAAFYWQVPTSIRWCRIWSDPSWQEDRTALENHEIAFADMLILRGLVLRTDLLGLISNFCTPEFETKRYDTFFFSALMPEGQVADGETSEAQIADWVTPAYAMRAGDAGNWLVLAPTVYNLTCIASAQNAKEFVETRRRLTRFMSYPIKKEDGTFMLHCDFPRRK